MGSARLHGTRRLKNSRVIQSLFERPGDEGGVHVIRKGLVSARYKILSPGRTTSGSGRSAYMRQSGASTQSGSPQSATPRAERFQFGVAVGRRTGNAVSRNKVKRILRERVRLRQTEIDRAVAAATASEPGAPGGEPSPMRPSLAMMLVSSGTADDASQIHRDTDRVITALIDRLTP